MENEILTKYFQDMHCSHASWVYFSFLKHNHIEECLKLYEIKTNS